MGERWALLVVRELLLGSKRFTDLRAGLPGVSPDVLAQRLRELEAAGVLTRRKLAPPAASQVYELTPRGRELEPVVVALGRWGSGTPVPEEGAVFGPDSAMLALKALFEPSAAEGVRATVELRLADQTFRARVEKSRLDVSRGDADAPDLIIDTDPATLAGVLWHGRDFGQALSAGDVRLEGSRREAQRFLRLFPLPGPQS